MCVCWKDVRGLKDNPRGYYEQRLKDGNTLSCTASFGCMECWVLWGNSEGCYTRAATQHALLLTGKLWYMCGISTFHTVVKEDSKGRYTNYHKLSGLKLNRKLLSHNSGDKKSQIKEKVWPCAPWCPRKDSFLASALLMVATGHPQCASHSTIYLHICMAVSMFLSVLSSFHEDTDLSRSSHLKILNYLQS